MGYESSMGHYILGVNSLDKGLAKEAVNHLKKVPSEKYLYRDLYLPLALRGCGKTKAAEDRYRNFLRRNPAGYLPAAVSEPAPIG
jgi:hypothetical protein